MEIKKLKLEVPKTTKVYSYREQNAFSGSETSTNTDTTTTCTSVLTSTHFNKV
jgi:hypothetical protein